MQVFIVVKEYLGPALPPRIPAPRLPTCEHAYDLESGTMPGHPAADQPRVGFPDGQHGWNSQPQGARCPDCDITVRRIVHDLIAAAVAVCCPGSELPEPTAAAHVTEGLGQRLIGPLHKTARPKTIVYGRVGGRRAGDRRAVRYP